MASRTSRRSRLTVYLFDDFRRDSTDDRMRWYVFGYDGAGCDDSASPNVHAVCKNRSRPNPDVVLHRDAFARDPLLDYGYIGVIEHVIHCQHLYLRRKVYTVTDGDAALTPQYAVLPDQ
jgi:hypothetical protein